MEELDISRAPDNTDHGARLHAPAMGKGPGKIFRPDFLYATFREMNMEVVTYQKGKWKAETHAEELASGKFQGIVLLFNEEGNKKEQILHRAFDVSDTVEAAMSEAKILALRLLSEL